MDGRGRWSPRCGGSETSPPQRGSLSTAVVFAAYALLCAVTLSRNLSAAHDSIGYLNDIESGRLFHPHHLLYNALAALWLAACRWVAPSADSLLVVPLLNALFGALSVACFHWLLRFRLRLDIPGAAAGALLLGASFGIWSYSGSIEVYVPPVFFLLLTLALLTAQRPTRMTLGLSGLAHAAAVLLHQSHVLFLPVSAWVWWTRGKEERRGAPGAVAAYLAVFVPVVVLPYLVVGVGALDKTSPESLWAWVTTYTRHPRAWDPLSAATLPRAAIGFSRCVIGGHFAFAIPAVRDILGRSMSNHWLADEAFLVRHQVEMEAWVLLMLSVLAGAALAAGTLARAVRRRPQSDGASVWLSIGFTWIFAYSAFFLFWEPSNMEFWIPQTVAAWLFLVAAWRPGVSRLRGGRVALWTLTSVGVVLLTVNFLGSIRWLMAPENDYSQVKARALGKMARRGDLIVIGHAWPLREHLRRFARSEVVALSDLPADDGGGSRLRDRFEHTLRTGGRIVVSDEVLEPTSLAARPLAEEQRHLARLVMELHLGTWTRIDTNTGPVGVLTVGPVLPGDLPP